MNETNSFDYEAEAQQTKSSSFHGHLIDLKEFVEAVNNCASWLQTLDAIKKTLFYGKEMQYAHIKGVAPFSTCAGIEKQFGENGVDIIHSIIGKATEAGELLELLSETLTGKSFDVTNFKEEIADGQWYDAIGLTAVDSTFNEVQRTNIAKLRARFPNKFQEYDAINRNLSNERSILEK